MVNPKIEAKKHVMEIFVGKNFYGWGLFVKFCDFTAIYFRKYK